MGPPSPTEGLEKPTIINRLIDRLRVSFATSPTATATATHASMEHCFRCVQEQPRAVAGSYGYNHVLYIHTLPLYSQYLHECSITVTSLISVQISRRQHFPSAADYCTSSLL